MSPRTCAQKIAMSAVCHWKAIYSINYTENRRDDTMGKGKGGNPNYPSTTGKPSGKGRGDTPK